jgi:hypothetical protein
VQTFFRKKGKLRLVTLKKQLDKMKQKEELVARVSLAFSAGLTLY